MSVEGSLSDISFDVMIYIRGPVTVRDFQFRLRIFCLLLDTVILPVEMAKKAFYE